MEGFDLYQEPRIDLLSPALKRQVALQYRAACFTATGCTREGGFGDMGHVPLIPMERHSVYRAGEGFGNYNHAPALVRFRSHFLLAWNSGAANEDAPGQCVLLSTSDDGRRWTAPRVILRSDAARHQFFMTAGFCVYRDTLYLLVMEKFSEAPDTGYTMTAFDPARATSFSNLWASEDGEEWRLVKRDIAPVLFMLHPPVLTPQGRLLQGACNFRGRPVALLWPGADPEEPPKIVEQPWLVDERHFHEGHDLGIWCYGENCFYSLDDGTLVMLFRNENGTCQLGVSISVDGGESWCPVMQSNFPDSASRLATGRLADGRFFIVGNSTRMYMDRNFFAISLSADGHKFDTMYHLVAEPTRQRLPGELKCHGYQYPAVFVDGNRLLIAYSVNKEDIECGIVTF